MFWLKKEFLKICAVTYFKFQDVFFNFLQLLNT